MSSPSLITAVADEVADAFAWRRPIAVPFTAREGGFDLGSAYAVEAELVRRRRAAGRRVVGRKIGFANKAVWRALKLETLVWAPMYDDTVVHAEAGEAHVALGQRWAPKIEPEIMFKLTDGLGADAADPAAALEHVEWMAAGFEIVDCPFPDWKLQPPDFVAAYGLHLGLVVGTPVAVDRGSIAAVVEALAACTVQLRRNGEVVAQGGGRNVLRSPALCLAELGSAVAGRPDQEPVAPGEIVTTGSTTDPQLIASGESWTMHVDGLGVEDVTVRLD